MVEISFVLQRHRAMRYTLHAWRMAIIQPTTMVRRAWRFWGIGEMYKIRMPIRLHPASRFAGCLLYN